MRGTKSTGREIVTETLHRVRVLAATGSHLTIEIDGLEISAPWEQLSPRLAKASAEARRVLEVSPAGYGIRWPLIDEDLSVEGIIRDFGSSRR